MYINCEFYVDPVCAYIIAYGEYDDGTNTAEERTQKAMVRWSQAEMMNMVLGDEIEGYSAIYTCRFCGDDAEGPGKHNAMILA